MPQTLVEFFSDGIRLEGVVYTPDAPVQRALRPGIIVNHGRFGIKEWVPSMLLPYFVAAGFVGFSFDYRNLGKSDGERGKLIPQEQVRDLRHAMTFLRQQPGVDPDRIGVLGWGLGGGVAVAAAAEDQRFRAVCCAGGLVDGLRYGRRSMTEAQWRQMQSDIVADRTDRVLSGKSRCIPRSRLAYDPLPGQGSHRYGWQESLKAAVGEERGSDPASLGIPDAITLESLEALYAFRPTYRVHRISPRPLLVIHAINDGGFPYEDALRLYQRAGSPKEFINVAEGDHRDWIDSKFPYQRHYVPAVVSWFERCLPQSQTGR